MKEEVKDSYGIVYFIFVLLGTATLLPWNVFLTEKEFYDVRFQVPPYNDFIADNFMSLFALCFNAMNLITLGFLIPYQRFMSLRVLVLQPLVITFLMLATTAALANKTDLPGDMMARVTLPSIGLMANKTDLPGDMMARVTLPSIGLMGLSTACLQGGTLQLASVFSPTHIRGVVSGIAVGGLVTSGLSFGVVSGIAVGGLVTSGLSFVSQLRATGDSDTPTAEDVAPAAFMYFSASAGVMLACLLGYSALTWLPYGRYKLLLAGIIDDPKERQFLNHDDDYAEPLLTVVEGEAGGSDGTQEVHRRAAIISVESDYSQRSRSWQMRNAFIIYCFALLMCLMVTMGTHPGVSSFICSSLNPAIVSPCTPRPESGRMNGDLFVPVLYVLFSVGDYLGRLLSGYGPWGRGMPKPLTLLFYAFCRIAIAFGILFCHIVTPTHWLLPEFLSKDIYPQVLVLLLGLTQGHLISTICMHAPATLLPSESSMYGPVTSFAISMGCFLGSWVSVAVSYFLQSHQTKQP
eukprot:gene16322-22512_t